MLRTAPLLALLLAACEPMPSSGQPLKPVTVAPAAPSAARAAPTTGEPAAAAPDPDSPFVEDQIFDTLPDPDAEPAGADLLFRAQLEGPEPAPAPARPVAVEPTPAPAPAPPAPPVWDGTAPPPGAGSWGVALLATLLDVQPPRAVVALPDGSEQVVQPGTFLPDHRLVVLAIGRDAIQVAHIEPMGWNSRVETHTLRSLFQP